MIRYAKDFVVGNIIYKPDIINIEVIKHKVTSIESWAEYDEKTGYAKIVKLYNTKRKDNNECSSISSKSKLLFNTLSSAKKYLRGNSYEKR